MSPWRRLTDMWIGPLTRHKFIGSGGYSLVISRATLLREDVVEGIESAARFIQSEPPLKDEPPAVTVDVRTNARQIEGATDIRATLEGLAAHEWDHVAISVRRNGADVVMLQIMRDYASWIDSTGDESIHRRSADLIAGALTRHAEQHTPVRRWRQLKSWTPSLALIALASWGLGTAALPIPFLLATASLALAVAWLIWRALRPQPTHMPDADPVFVDVGDRIGVLRDRENSRRDVSVARRTALMWGPTGALLGSAATYFFTR
jgi:hypothetical protein